MQIKLNLSPMKYRPHLEVSEHTFRFLHKLGDIRLMDRNFNLDSIRSVSRGAMHLRHLKTPLETGAGINRFNPVRITRHVEHVTIRKPCLRTDTQHASESITAAFGRSTELTECV